VLIAVAVYMLLLQWLYVQGFLNVDVFPSLTRYVPAHMRDDDDDEGEGEGEGDE
jgi:hypothetical protein